MEILTLDLEATAVASAVRELSRAFEWETIDSSHADATVNLARSLTASHRVGTDATPLTPELTRFLTAPNPPWGLSILRNLPATDDPRRSLVLLSELMGQVVRFEEEGDFVVEVKDDPSTSGGRPGFNNSKEFFPHTDLSYLDCPPDFLCLHGIDIDVAQGGLSEFADIRDIERQLDAGHIQALRQSDFLFPAPRHNRDGNAIRKAILSRGLSGRDEIRFRRDDLRCTKRDGMDAVVGLCRAIQENMTEIVLAPGSVAVLDNRRVLHGRTAFLGRSAATVQRHINRLYFQSRAGNTVQL